MTGFREISARLAEFDECASGMNGIRAMNLKFGETGGATFIALENEAYLCWERNGDRYVLEGRGTGDNAGYRLTREPADGEASRTLVSRDEFFRMAGLMLGAAAAETGKTDKRSRLPALLEARTCKEGGPAEIYDAGLRSGALLVRKTGHHGESVSEIVLDGRVVRVAPRAMEREMIGKWNTQKRKR